MGSETTSSPNEPRSRNLDERDEGEGEDAREPPAEAVEEEGTVKEEVQWIVVRNFAWDGNVRRTTGEGYNP